MGEITRTLTEALFGITSPVEVQPEKTRGFVESEFAGVDGFRYYMLKNGHSETLVEEILLEIHRRIKKLCIVNPDYEELLAVASSEIGAYYLDLGSDRAEEFLIQAFNLRSKLHSSENAFKLARTMNRLGIFYVQREKFENAEVMFEDAYTIFKEIYELTGEHGEDYAIAASNLGTFYYETYRAEEGLKYLFEALEIGGLPGYGAVTHYNIALCYEDLGDCERAAEHFIKAVSLDLKEKFLSIRDVVERAQSGCGDAFFMKLREMLEKGEIGEEVFERIEEVVGEL